ncbi:hypothetical protein M405DRAFT_813318 [Rhizopogon salebrosus TDB-379]|nr:hypothetical protein M405DRAFT_813318 [Rhizopogon salebrosus TDB-379]
MIPTSVATFRNRSSYVLTLVIGLAVQVADWTVGESLHFWTKRVLRNGFWTKRVLRNGFWFYHNDGNAQQHPGSPPADYLSDSLSAILRTLDALNTLQYLLSTVIHALILPL